MAYQLADLRGQRLARDPEQMLKNLHQELDLRFSVGIWYFTPGGGRFHDRFVPEATLEERLELSPLLVDPGLENADRCECSCSCDDLPDDLPTPDNPPMPDHSGTGFYLGPR